MSSSRNTAAPEWFGGGAKTAKRPESSKSQSRSSSNSKSSRRKEIPASSERRKRSNHQRKRSKDVDFFEKPQDINGARVERKSRPKTPTSKERNERKKKSPTKQKKPSFVERLFGFTSNDSDEILSQTKNGDSPPANESPPHSERVRTNSFGTAKSDPNSSPQKQSDSTSATSDTHRRIHSDPSQFIAFSSYDYGSVIPRESNYVEAHTSLISPPSSKSTVPIIRAPFASYPTDDRIANANQSDDSAIGYSGAESDDIFVYSDHSDDELTSAQPRTSYPIHKQTKNSGPYPYGQYQSNESRQMMEHHQMMALAPNRRVASLKRQSNSHSQYGSISTQPPISTHPPPRSKTPPGNEFYVSEDDTLLSESSKSLSLNSRGQRQKYAFMYANDGVSNIILEEENGKTESSPPTLSTNNNSATSERSNNSKSGSSNSGNRNVQKVSPPGKSTTSSSSSGSDSNRIQRPLHSPSISRKFPPPPVKSVSIHARTVSTGTATTASASVNFSPHNMFRMQHVPPALQPLPQQRRLSRKENKRLARMIEIEELREDKIQTIIRSGQADALDWSQHVSQEVRGLNRPAGFFPHHKKEKYHDVAFAVLFLVQMGTVIYLGMALSGETMMDSLKLSTFESEYSGDPVSVADEYNDDPFSTGTSLAADTGSTLSNWANDIHVDYSNALQLACITALYATSLSALSIGMMMILGRALIPTILCLAVIVCIGLGTIGVALSPYSSIPIVGIIFLAVTLGYSIVVWDRIPFAATNLDTALCGVKCSADVLIVGLVMMMCSFFWTIGWSVAFLGIYDHYLDKTDTTWVGLSIYLGMFISYFWTLNVMKVSNGRSFGRNFFRRKSLLHCFLWLMKNIIHVTVAGVVTSWWTDPESLTSCCNNVLRKQFVLSLTSSFGSICLGSLVSPALEVLRHTLGICWHSSIQPQGLESNHDNVILGEHSVHSDPSNLALLPVPKSPIDGAIKYFNDYGFTYMGIYREKFQTSSFKATEVFEMREWVGVVSDKLIDTVLCIMTIAITLATGAFGLVVEEFDGYSFSNFQKPTSTAFFIGCLIGWVVSSVYLKVVSSSVSTVLVCFSLAPWKFSVNHPVLSKEMRASWGGIWLDEYDWLNIEEREMGFL